LKFGFKKMAKRNDYILIKELGDAFRHAGQNPAEDVIKDMIDKAKGLKKPNQAVVNDEGLYINILL
jgi:Ca2+-binding EF-hand superfamily protein